MLEDESLVVWFAVAAAVGVAVAVDVDDDVALAVPMVDALVVVDATALSVMLKE